MAITTPVSSPELRPPSPVGAPYDAPPAGTVTRQTRPPWVRGQAAWQQDALARCQVLRARWAALGGAPFGEIHEQFEALLQNAEEACTGQPVWRRIGSAWSGILVERVWANVHAAEVLLVENHPPEKVAEVATHVADQVRAELPAANRQVRLFRDGGLAKGTTPRAAAMALQSAHSASAGKHRRVRSFRNTVYIASGVVLLAVVGLVILGWQVPAALPMCTEDGKQCLLGTTQPGAAHVLVVAAIGAAAGILSGITSIRRMRGTSTPYSIPAALWLFKAPCGALSAVLGLQLVRAGLGEELGATSVAALIAWAVVFGAAQELVTRLADQQGQVVLDAVRSGTGNAPNPSEQQAA